MTERKDDMGAVTHQLSAVDDDMHKTANVKEAHVASVALGKLFICYNVVQDRYIRLGEDANSTQLLLSRPKSQNFFLGA
jgi:hypothetical protein